MKQNQRPDRTIPIFFAADDNYAPCLAVAIRSLIAHASPDRSYGIFVLIDRMNPENMTLLCSLGTENVTIRFVNVGDRLDKLGSMMHLRDYYTKATYYRFFIPELFPQFDKGLYLDCDVIILDDVAGLYDTALGADLLAAAPEEIMSMVDVFGRYAEVCLGVPRADYFSAGVLLMNLAELRRVRIERQFSELLGRVRYRVTQDQDYLNVLCRGRVRLIDTTWNRTACPSAGYGPVPKLVHFKINWKPWHYEHVAFGDTFWTYAAETPYRDVLRGMLDAYTDAERARDAAQYEALCALAASEIRAQQNTHGTAPGCFPAPDMTVPPYCVRRAAGANM